MRIITRPRASPDGTNIARPRSIDGFSFQAWCGFATVWDEVLLRFADAPEDVPELFHPHFFEELLHPPIQSRQDHFPALSADLPRHGHQHAEERGARLSHPAQLDDEGP